MKSRCFDTANASYRGRSMNLFRVTREIFANPTIKLPSISCMRRHEKNTRYVSDSTCDFLSGAAELILEHCIRCTSVIQITVCCSRLEWIYVS